MKSNNNLKISVVIPNYNGYELMSQNLKSVVLASDSIKNNICEIIVVDDGSTDSSISFLNSNYKGLVKIIKHTKNRGFSSAVNTGVRASGGDLILLLNNDVSVEKNFLVTALEHFKDPKVFSVSLHEDGYGYAKGSFENGFIKLSMGKEEKVVKNSFYTSGGSGIFRKSIWKELGGMDEKLFSPYYWEDIDLCFRASKRGYINLWDPSLKVNHKHESTVSKLNIKKVNTIRERNELTLIWKNIHSPNLFKKHILGIFKRIVKHPGYLKIVLITLLRVGIIMKERKSEIKESRVGDEAVFSQYS